MSLAFCVILDVIFACILIYTRPYIKSPYQLSQTRKKSVFFFPLEKATEWKFVVHFLQVVP